MSRREEYLRPDGTWSPSRRDAHRTAPAEVRAAVQAVDTPIPLGYFLGTAQHESNYAVNERDTEESGFQSWGIYQLSHEEAGDLGMAGADLLSLQQSTELMARLAEARRHALRACAHIKGEEPADLYSYLAIAHNEGLHAAMQSIIHYGLDWAAYRHRNPKARIVTSGYGDDVR